MWGRGGPNFSWPTTHAVDHFSGQRYDTAMAWTVEVKEAAVEHLRWFGKKTGRKLLQTALRFLKQDPLAETKNLKTLRPNPVAERELRLLGKYRVLFSVNDKDRLVTVILVGEKRGNRLLVLGEEFSAHHESDPIE
jgi:mRNA-degrading endonuclease RelE of RelBE toxin-antitoxin system